MSCGYGSTVVNEGLSLIADGKPSMYSPQWIRDVAYIAETAPASIPRFQARRPAAAHDFIRENSIPQSVGGSQRIPVPSSL